MHLLKLLKDQQIEPNALSVMIYISFEIQLPIIIKDHYILAIDSKNACLQKYNIYEKIVAIDSNKRVSYSLTEHNMRICKKNVLEHEHIHGSDVW